MIERGPHTGLLVSYVPGFPDAHSPAESLDELRASLNEAEFGVACPWRGA